MNFRKRIILFAVPLLWLAFAGCTKEFACMDSHIRLAFVNFSPADLDTLVIRKFELETGFQKALDSTEIRKASANNSKDTITVFDGYSEIQITPGFNWQVYISSLEETVSISQISTEKRSEKRSSFPLFSMEAYNCINPIPQALVDGKRVRFLDYEHPQLYIVK